MKHSDRIAAVIANAIFAVTGTVMLSRELGWRVGVGCYLLAAYAKFGPRWHVR